MIIEEKKACEHWCPHVRHPGEEGGTFNRGSEEGDEINTGRAFGNWSCACIGARCMAWRWAGTTHQIEDREYGPVIVAGGPSTTHGYCGLAGRP